MLTVLWLIAVVLIIFGIVKLVQGEVILGVVLIIIGLLIGPGGVSIFAATVAHASPPVDPAGPVDLGDTVASIRVSAQLVTLIVGAIIPILVGLVTRLADKYKGVLMILLNAISSAIVVATMSDGTAVFSQQTIVNIVPGLVASLVAYYGVLKPHGVTSSTYTPPGSSTPVTGRLADVGRK